MADEEDIEAGLPVLTSPRWANAAETEVLAEIDGVTKLIPRGHSLLAGLAPESIAPFPLAAVKAARVKELEAYATALRVAVAGTNDATKIAIYREKYAVAVEAVAGDEAALAKLAPEAAARGETPEQLAALVKMLGEAWTAAGLAIDARYQALKAQIEAAADAAAVAGVDITQGWPA